MSHALNSFTKQIDQDENEESKPILDFVSVYKIKCQDLKTEPRDCILDALHDQLCAIFWLHIV